MRFVVLSLITSHRSLPKWRGHWSKILVYLLEWCGCVASWPIGHLMVCELHRSEQPPPVHYAIHNAEQGGTKAQPTRCASSSYAFSLRRKSVRPPPRASWLSCTWVRRVGGLCAARKTYMGANLACIGLNMLIVNELDVRQRDGHQGDALDSMVSEMLESQRVILATDNRDTEFIRAVTHALLKVF